MKFWSKFLKLLEDLFKKLNTNLDIIAENTNVVAAYEANEEPIVEVAKIPVVLLMENEDRQNLVIQNIGLSPCYIKLGEDITPEDFHFILAPDSYEKFGNGGSIELINWKGRVHALCEKEQATVICVLEY